MAEKVGQNEQWSSRWGLVFAAIGMAVGTGNIWRFPRVCAINGGGAFFIAYVIALFLWAIPLLSAEAVWGKVSRMGVVGSFKEMVGRKWTWVGGFVAWVSLAIAFYYAVVLGWCIRYLLFAVTGVMRKGVDTEALWKGFINDPMQGALFFVIALAMSLAVIFMGVQNGLEKGNKIMIPIIFVLLIFLAVKTAFLPGAMKGYEYMFTIRMSDVLNPRTYLDAFTQVAWSTGAGWGLFLTYYVYSTREEDILQNSLVVGAADTLAALLAALCVVPTVFALSPDPIAAVRSGDAGLAFIHLSRLFLEIPGGNIMAAAFFLTLVFAAVSSELSMLEMGVRILADAGWKRRRAVLAVGALCLLMGTPSALNVRFLENQDRVWGVGLLISGVCFSFGAMKAGVRRLWVEYIEPWSEVRQEWMWSLIRFFPLWFVLIFVWWMRRAILLHPYDWTQWFPFTRHTDTPMTMIAQWGAAAAISLLLGGKLAAIMRHRFDPDA